jgi:hypothetical protein
VSKILEEGKPVNLIVLNSDWQPVYYNSLSESADFDLENLPIDTYYRHFPP